MDGGRRWCALLVVIAVGAWGCAGGGDGDGDGDRAATVSTDEPRPAQVESAAPALPEARRDGAGALWQGEIVVAGGVVADGSATARVDMFEPARGVWRRGVDLPSPMHHFAMVVLGDRLWVVGGAVGSAGRPTAEVWSLGLGEPAWRPEAPLATARVAPGAAVVASGSDSTLVVAGGSGPGGLLASIEIYSVATATWRPGPDLTLARDHVALTTVGSTVWAMSGAFGKPNSTTAHVETLELGGGGGGDRWTELPPGLDIDRGGAAGFTFEGRPCVAGGEPWRGPHATNDAYAECLHEGVWRRFGAVPRLRHGAAVVLAGSVLHLLGGGTQSGRYVVDDHDVVPLAPPPPIGGAGG